MLDRLKGYFSAHHIRVTILGMVGQQVVRADEQLVLRGAPTVAGALKAAGRRAGVDLVGAIRDGADPALLLNGERLSLPHDLARSVPDGAHLAWLLPMAGG